AIAVFCGSSFGSQKAYQLAAVSLGKALAGSHRPLVFGATNNGIMGILSSTVREAGGNIVGITPYAMVAAGGEEQKAKGASLVDIDLAVEKNVQEELILVESMHDRKREMAQRSCGFVALPGGFGTMEEVLEVTTWTQIGIHQKPVVVLNVLGFYNHLRQLVRHAVRTGFISPDNERLITFVNGP
ncbi:hypothetical protein PUNSTDRAFT_36633, partial [Punctularia strigosozonata HHB-11173 SS5]|uniref:uncharacterized protein n=1 Tax=Punctularia strigosozonata (strain HHB-11173) TaxID=741275 RepID=UPI0004417599